MYFVLSALPSLQPWRDDTHAKNSYHLLNTYWSFHLIPTAVLKMGVINISVLQMRKLELRKVKELAEGQQLVSGSSLSSWTWAQVLLAAVLFLLQLPRDRRQRACSRASQTLPHVSVKPVLRPADVGPDPQTCLTLRHVRDQDTEQAPFYTPGRVGNA